MLPVLSVLRCGASQVAHVAGPAHPPLRGRVAARHAEQAKAAHEDHQARARERDHLVRAKMRVRWARARARWDESEGSVCLCVCVLLGELSRAS